MIEHIEVDGIGPVTISKRKGSKTIRIGLSQDGTVKLSLPHFVSTAEGLRFLDQKKSWIATHRQEKLYLEDGARIGKAHTLKILPTDASKAKSIVSDNTILVYIPEHFSADQVQSKLEEYTKKVLQKQAAILLPKQLQQYAALYGFTYTDCTVKPLQSRWGSCSSRNEIVLNTYLMQLPWELIDYVVLHELAHTVHHNHSDEFWRLVASHLPDYKKRRAAVKKFPTSMFDIRHIDTFVA